MLPDQAFDLRGKPRHHNPRVGGSSPSSATNKINELASLPIVMHATPHRLRVNWGKKRPNTRRGLKIRVGSNPPLGTGLFISKSNS